MRTNLLSLTVLLGVCALPFASSGQQKVLLASIDKAAGIPEKPSSTLQPETTDEEQSAFSLSGTIDTYFHTTFGTSNNFYGGMYAPASAFSDLKGFGLGMANIIAKYEGEKAGFTADLVFGPRGRAAVFTSEQGIVNQMYAFYKLADKVTLNIGQFNTFLGYEVISPAVNFHYSTSYMFSYGPFNHTGVRADFDLGGGLVAKLAVMNPTDLVEFNPVNTYTLGAQVGHSNEAGGVWLNFLYGDQDGTLRPGDDPYERDESGAPVDFLTSDGSLFQADLTAGWDVGEKFYIGLNTSYQAVGSGEAFIDEGNIADSESDPATFIGIALYPKVSVSQAFALGIRGEYFRVTNGHLGIFGLNSDNEGSVMAYTLSANCHVGDLTFIPEFRVDVTSSDSFLNASGKETRVMSGLNVAAVYKF